MKLALILMMTFAPVAFAESDEALVQQAEKLIQEETAAAKPVTVETVKTEAPKESDIPVTFAAKPTEASHGNIAWRLIASVALIAVVGGACMFASRRWSKGKDKGGKQARIEILHQLHMGPRKSIALVRVSGETMLVGITDHNINMLKPVTLIDDELEGVLSKDFNNFLEDEFSVEDVRSALRARA